MTSALVFLLYLFGIPYILLMVMVVVGMFRRPATGRSRALPSVSVVLPAHNEEAKLAGTLSSLAGQVYGGPLEFVIVDDRSSDGTRQIIEEFAARDARFRLVSVESPSRKLAPKVNAVDHGIRRSNGEIIMATDADCRYHPEWVAGMVERFEDDVAMVVGYVSTSRPGEATSLLQRFESVDWFTLMLVSRSMTRFGLKFASSANNLAYRRGAFESVGGFGAAGRAPSGDEDLLTQRLGRISGSRVVFAEEPRTRVLTQGAPSTRVLLRQRRRWVSRYHHVLHYHPGFMTGIAALGLQSVFLSLSLLLIPFLPALLPWVAGLWLVKALVEWTGMGVGTRQFGRRDLWGLSTLWWILWHPAFIAVSVIGSFLSPAAWHAGAESYRRRFFQRRLREFRRRLRAAALRS
ncbi:MAG: glycosyltransferase [Trueperaceae bacterium]